MIPFITKHVFGLPRTRTNQNIVKLKLRNLGSLLLQTAGAIILAVMMYFILNLVFSL